MSSTQQPIFPIYRGRPYLFCRSNIFYEAGTCSETPFIPPKKARVYNKPEHTMTKNEFYKWVSRNKYR